MRDPAVLHQRTMRTLCLIKETWTKAFRGIANSPIWFTSNYLKSWDTQFCMKIIQNSWTFNFKLSLIPRASLPHYGLSFHLISKWPVES